MSEINNDIYWQLTNTPVQHQPNMTSVDEATLYRIEFRKTANNLYFYLQLMETAQRLGVTINRPENFKNADVRGINDVFKSNPDVDLFIILVSGKDEYATIKNWAELKTGCLTQCIMTQTILKSEFNPSSLLTNLLLKINAKMDGTNHNLSRRPSFLKGDVMIMGADVTHPGPSARDIPSFAAVTASHDQDFFKYNTVIQVQPPTQEVIVDVGDIVKSQLKYHYKHTKSKPQHIIFFRDGVSEGQFEKLISQELFKIQAACASLDHGKYKPKITFVVVMKRHHTRFFLIDSDQNVFPGTCVDTGITHPRGRDLKDFYLASHKAIKGTARPTKYCTIYDDANLSYDDIEELANYLCYMYSRCTSAVSYPTPTYYAHLAADRAKTLLKNEHIDMEKLESVGKIPITVKINDTKPMFFV